MTMSWTAAITSNTPRLKLVIPAKAGIQWLRPKLDGAGFRPSPE